MQSSERLLRDAQTSLEAAKKAKTKLDLLDSLSLLKSFLNAHPDFELYEKVVNISEDISAKLAKNNSRVNKELKKELEKIIIEVPLSANEKGSWKVQITSSKFKKQYNFECIHTTKNNFLATCRDMFTKEELDNALFTVLDNNRIRELEEEEDILTF